MATFVSTPSANAAMRTTRWPARLAWTTLGVNVAVVLWGAYVRASQSGAGCGSHWPLCNGEVMMHAPRWHTIVEFTHRASSGVAVFLVAALCVVTFLSTEKRNLARWAAGLAAFLVFNEALLGALLVLLRKVAMDQSVGRAVYLCAHSANTLLLLAAITLTTYWLAFPEDSLRSRYPRKATQWLAALGATLLTLLAATTGAIAALGDTLFPATTLHQAWAQDFATNSHYALRLRGLHPLSALWLVLYVLPLLRKFALRDATSRRMTQIVTSLLLLQFALGIADALLLAPLWLQLVHLFGADLFWIGLVVTVARTQPRMTQQAAPDAV